MGCAAGGALAALSVAACSGSNDQATNGQNQGASVPSGTISAQFLLPSGSVTSGSYTLTGPGGFTRTQSLDFEGIQEIAFAIDDVPAGSGYTLAFTAGAGDGGESCSGSTTFDVTASATAMVNVTATCTGAPYVPDGYGSIEVWVTPPAGVSLGSAACTLTGPAGVEAQDNLTVNGTEGIHFTLQSVPSGAGQLLSLTATTSDGGKTCTASKTLDVTANQMAEAMVTLQCQ
jgi:hypothetical protein